MDSVERFASLLFEEPGQVIELRALGGRGAPGKGVVAGYFDDPGEFEKAARSLDGDASGVYFTLNPVNPALLARAHNRVVSGPKSLTGDADVSHRRFLLIDIDPTRPSDVSATDEEKETALALAKEVVAYLEASGFPEPLKADSGNGAHIVYGADLPADDDGLIKRVLEALAFRFDTKAAQVDRTVHNPARISKLYGTMACKGDSTPERPHRRSRLFSVPVPLVPVPRGLLEQLANECAPPASKAAKKGTHGDFDLERYLAEHNLTYARTGPWLGGRKYVLDVCPFDSSHVDNAAYVVQHASGAIAAGCHHNGCDGKGWHDLRDLLEPGWRDRRGASGTYDTGGGGPSTTEWSTPHPIPDELLPVPKLSRDLLPDAVRPWIFDIADRMQCPPEFPAVSALVCLATVVGRKVGIRPKRRDDWLVVVNLWGAVVGRPGVLKTPAIQQPINQLIRLEMAAREDFDAAGKIHRAKKLAWDARKKKATQGGGNKQFTEEDARRLLEEEPAPPTRRRYVTNDATVEKLGELLRDSPNGILAFRDEIVGLLKSLDKEGHEGARAFYLESWNGTGRFTYDRIGRGTVEIPAAIVSVLGGIQPGPLRSYVAAAANAGGADDGLIQRLQLIVWPDISNKWKNVDRWPDTDARRAAFEVFQHLDRMDPDVIGAKGVDESDPQSIPYLNFDESAQERFDEWHAGLEAVVRSGDEEPALEAHLSKYRSLVPSLALIFHLVDGGRGPVSLEALVRATGWAEFLEPHARRLHGVAFDPDMPAARALAKKLRAKALKDGFALSDVYRPHWSGIASRDDAERAVGVLVDLDWLRVVTEPTGGRPKTSYSINPGIYAMGEKGTERSAGSGSHDPSSTSCTEGGAPSQKVEDEEWHTA